MNFFAVYSGRVAVGFSRNLRKAKDIAHEKHADEIQELHISEVKDVRQVDLVRKWKQPHWSSIFVECYQRPQYPAEE